MRAVLEFDLPDDDYDFGLAVKARDAHLAVCEFGEYLREQDKYTEPKDRDDLVKIRERWFEIMDGHLE